MSIHVLRHEVSKLYQDQPEVLKAICSGIETSGVLCTIRDMTVHVVPVWLHTSNLPLTRRIALGFVNEIWTLCIAPKGVQTTIPEFGTTPWDRNGSLIHLNSNASYGDIGRLNTILLATTISQQVWKEFAKQEPTCLTLMYKKQFTEY